MTNSKGISVCVICTTSLDIGQSTLNIRSWSMKWRRNDLQFSRDVVSLGMSRKPCFYFTGNRSAYQTHGVLDKQQTVNWRADLFKRINEQTKAN